MNANDQSAVEAFVRAPFAYSGPAIFSVDWKWTCRFRANRYPPELLGSHQDYGVYLKGFGLKVYLPLLTGRTPVYWVLAGIGKRLFNLIRIGPNIIPRSKGRR